MMQGDPNSDDEAVEIAEHDVQEVIDLPPNEEQAMDLALDGMDLSDQDDDHTDEADVVFSKHNGPVFCVGLEPQSASLAVTGGKDDMAYVWKTNTGEEMYALKGHKDSVIEALFSSDGKYIATTDMEGLIKVWLTKDGSEINNLETSDVQWMCWHPAAPVILLGTVDGPIWMWKVIGGDTKIFSHHVPCMDGQVMPDGKHLVAGYASGDIKLWNMKDAVAVQSIQGFHNPMAHTGQVNCLDCFHDNRLVISGTNTGEIQLSNMAAGTVIANYSKGCADDNSFKYSVEAAKFAHGQSQAATGTMQGNVSFWDLPTNIERCQVILKASVTRLVWDAADQYVYVGDVEGGVNLVDTRTGKLEKRWREHEDHILDLKLSSNGSFFVTTSEDGTAKIVHLNSPER